MQALLFYCATYFLFFSAILLFSNDHLIHVTSCYIMLHFNTVHYALCITTKYTVLLKMHPTASHVIHLVILQYPAQGLSHKAALCQRISCGAAASPVSCYTMLNFNTLHKASLCQSKSFGAGAGASSVSCYTQQ